MDKMGQNKDLAITNNKGWSFDTYKGLNLAQYNEDEVPLLNAQLKHMLLLFKLPKTPK